MNGNLTQQRSLRVITEVCDIYTLQKIWSALHFTSSLKKISKQGLIGFCVPFFKPYVIALVVHHALLFRSIVQQTMDTCIFQTLFSLLLICHSLHSVQQATPYYKKVTFLIKRSVGISVDIQSLGGAKYKETSPDFQSIVLIMNRSLVLWSLSSVVHACLLLDSAGKKLWQNEQTNVNLWNKIIDKPNDMWISFFSDERSAEIHYYLF